MVQSFNCATINITIQQRAPNNQSLTQDFPNNLSTTQPTNHGTQTANSTSLEIIHCLMQIFAAFAGNQALIQQWHRLANHKGFFFLVFLWIHILIHSVAPLLMSTHLLLTFLFSHLFTFCTFWFADRLTISVTQQTSHPPLSFIHFSLFSLSRDLPSCLLTHFLTQLLTPFLNYSLTHFLTYSFTHLLTFLLIYSLYHFVTYLLTWSTFHLLPFR